MTAAHGSGLLERDGVLADAEDRVAQALDRRGRLLVVEGEAGVGKTRLLAALGARWPAATVARAAGGQYEADLAFGVARQLLEPLLGAEALAGAAGDVPADLDVGAVLHDLYRRTVAVAADQPLVLVVDDVQWADAPSVRLLAYLARRLPGHALALVVGLRAGAETAALAALRPPAVPADRLLVRPLSAEGTGRFLEGRLPGCPPAFARACHAATGGNPFLLEALVRTLRDREVDVRTADPAVAGGAASADVAAWVAAQLAPLGPDAAALLDALAILGDGAPPALLARLAEVADEPAARAADALTDAGLLRADGVTFVHPLVHAAVRDALPAGRRALADRRAARLLAGAFDDVARAAAHLRRTPPAGEAWAADVLDVAAERALREGAPDDAVALWRRCLAEPPADAARFGVLLALGRLECAVADPAGLPRLEEAHARAPDRAAAATAALARARALQLRGELAANLAVLESALAALGDASAALSREIEGELCILAISALPVRARTLARLQPHVDAARAGRPIEDPAVQAGVGAELAVTGHTEAGLRWVRAALAAPELTRRGGAAAPVARMVLPVCEAWDEAVAVYDAVLADPRRSVFFAADALACRALALLSLGDVAAAEDGARAAMALVDGHIADPSKLATLADALRERGELATALQTTEVVTEAGPLDDVILGQMLIGARVRALFAAGHHEEALTAAERARSFEAAWGLVNPYVVGWREPAALALHARGRGDEARALAAESAARIGDAGLPVAAAVARRTEALLAAGGPDVVELRAVAAVLAGTPARLERARTLVMLGEALLGAGRQAEAREALAAGREQADLCGAAALEEQAHAALIASGARPRRIARSGADALTPAEDRVARLAAQGLANPAIADRLVVSRRTVEMHLSNAYRKLGIDSRQGLAAALDERPAA